ncbi:hypothetical protein Tco_0984857 [Tanacetum coccineum]
MRSLSTSHLLKTPNYPDIVSTHAIPTRAYIQPKMLMLARVRPSPQGSFSLAVAACGQYLEKQLPMEMNDLLQSLNDIFCVVSLSPADMDGWQWVLDGIFTVKHMSDIVDSAT